MNIDDRVEHFYYGKGTIVSMFANGYLVKYDIQNEDLNTPSTYHCFEEFDITRHCQTRSFWFSMEKELKLMPKIQNVE